MRLFRSILLSVLAAVAVFGSVAQAANPETILYASKTYDPASATTGVTVNTTLTVETAAFGDFCGVSFSISVASTTWSCAITAANTVTIYVANVTAGTIDLGSGTVRVRVVKRPPLL